MAVRSNFLKRFTPIFIMLAVILATVFVFLACSPKAANPTESIHFGAIPSGSAALVYIAQEQGFFAANGLSVNVTDYPTGIATTDALLKGEVDVAWAAELPLVRRVLAGEKISIIAVSSKFNDQHLFGRRDNNIKSIADFKGKTIGVPLNTIAEFYLARFLGLNGLNIQDISLINVSPPQSIEAMTDGSIDGVVTWEPYSSQMKEQMADKVVFWPVQSSQPGYGINIVRNDWLASHPDTAQRFLKSLAEAENYLLRNPEAAKSLVQRRVNYDDALMAVSWPTSQFSLFLDQSLITAMEDEARWLMSSNQTSEKEVPNFLDYIQESSLKAVKPSAVNIIR